MKTNKYILSIVIPVYNREKLIIDVLNSIERQDCPDAKIIVVDDGSTDQTVDNINIWIENHKNIEIRLFRSYKNCGASAARNRGLALVDSEFTMFFDSDDLMTNGFLNKLVRKLKVTDKDIIGWDVYFNGRGKSKRIFKSYNLWQNHLVHAILSTQRFVARTSLFIKVGLWDENLRCWNDYELGIRLLALSPSVEKLHENFKDTVVVRYTAESITGRSVGDEPMKWIDSLNKVEYTLIKVAPDYIGWIQYRRAVLAAQFKKCGLSDASIQQLNKAYKYNVISPFGVKMIYCFHKIFGRGSWILAKLFIKR